ncbi:MAG: hydrogenase nickel incorporation protein HypB [Lachnospiraceae bacterium]|nr:hydrogenase nickel incorporation protein HypB [Candidatus Equihabitans merdae]
MEREVQILELKQNVFEANKVNADTVRADSQAKKQLMINVMSSPGSGKTTTLVRTIKDLQPDIRVAVMECDIDASVDAETIAKAGARSIQLHTGGMCHMDAQMTQQGLDQMGTDDLDLIFIENVGNLVCPAEFDTGAALNITILSVPEGDDKPAKYPLVYEVSDLVLINKIDALPVFDFRKDYVESCIHELNPDAKIIYVSSKTGEGFEEWTNWLKEKVAAVKAGQVLTGRMIEILAAEAH